jgi:hypothetical protein
VCVRKRVCKRVCVYVCTEGEVCEYECGSISSLRHLLCPILSFHSLSSFCLSLCVCLSLPFFLKHL